MMTPLSGWIRVPMETSQQLVRFSGTGMDVSCRAWSILPAQFFGESARSELRSKSAGGSPSLARFWLDKGVDGFRLDAINFVFMIRNCAIILWHRTRMAKCSAFEPLRDTPSSV